MTYRIKVPPRTLPVDEAHLVSGLEHWVLGLANYRWSILVGFLLLLLIGGGTWGVFWYDTQNADKAQELEREATLHLFTRATNDPQKAAANLKEAIALYKRIIDEYPRTPTAPLAQFSLGNAYLQSNDLASAIEAYTRFISTYGTHVSLLGLVQQKLGYAYLLKGDLDQAAKAYSRILEIPGAMNRDYALFELARLEENRPRPDEALKHYQDLMKTFPNSPLTSDAAMRVKVIEAKKTPEPSPPSATPASPASSSSKPPKP
ncbi:MAG: tetratricopeptide repeat protein [Nitrospira sp. LK70]|nr:tetratricopeptide repeat protein [Nitrospira sp. LK70]